MWRKDSDQAVPSKTVRVGTPIGLHARPAAVIAEAAGQFEEDVFLNLVGVTDDEDTDAASSLMIMAMGAQGGDSITISSEDTAAVEHIADLIESNLDSR